MKTKIMIACALVALAACTREKTEETNNVMLTYGVHGTRAEVAEVLEGMLPAQIKVTLTSATGERYEVYTGSAVNLPLGDYSVTGEAVPAETLNIYADGSASTGTSPYVTIADNITIDYDTRAVALSARLDCIALAYSRNIVDQILIHNEYTNEQQVYVAEQDTFGITFLRAGLDRYALGVRVLPQQGQPYREQEFFIGNGAKAVSNGKYYYVSPTEITEVEPNITIDYPMWENGNE